MKTRCRILFILTVLIVSVSAAIYISAAAEGGMKMNFTHILNIQIPGVTLKDVYKRQGLLTACRIFQAAMQYYLRTHVL